MRNTKHIGALDRGFQYCASNLRNSYVGCFSLLLINLSPVDFEKGHRNVNLLLCQRRQAKGEKIKI